MPNRLRNLWSTTQQATERGTASADIGLRTQIGPIFTMADKNQQQAFDAFASRPDNPVYVSRGVSFRTVGTNRVVTVHGVIYAHYDVSDRVSERWVMVNLWESDYATQRELARAFGYSTRSVRRFAERVSAEGINALGRRVGRPVGAGVGKHPGRDRAILQLKARGLSNRAIAGRLGISETAIRKRLRSLNWQAPPHPQKSLLGGESIAPQLTSARARPLKKISADKDARGKSTSATRADDEEELLPTSDHDPLDRSGDRSMAALGFIADALPMFAPAQDLPMAGALLAIPSLLASGILPISRRLYGNIGPAFYGLRTTIVAYVLLSLLRIPRAENLKEHEPTVLGRVIGLDRILEVKTLRRKLTVLAERHRSHQLGLELAKRRIADRGRLTGFLYLDGHVRTYHGHHKIPKGYDTRRRLAVPATTDYWVNDRTGDPLLVVTAEANAGMVQMLEPMLKEARILLGEKRRATVVFDRGGWSPAVFKKILKLNFDILTYRKGRYHRVADRRFVLRHAVLDGRRIKYMLFDEPVRFLKGKLRLRQVLRLSEDGHQTAIITSRWDLSDIQVAYRMFDRWRQENFFKYMREEYLIDGLVDYQVELDDPERSVPNPKRYEVDAELRKARAALKKVQEAYGAAALGRFERGTASLKELTGEKKKIHDDLVRTRKRVKDLRARQKKTPKRVPLAQARQNEAPVKLAAERKHLTNVLKLVAYQIESDLVKQLRPHYARTDDEGRTLIQAALRSRASLSLTLDTLNVTLSPLSSPHRSKAIAALCDFLTECDIVFPGTKLRMRFGVSGQPCVAGSAPTTAAEEVKRPKSGQIR